MTILNDDHRKSHLNLYVRYVKVAAVKLQEETPVEAKSLKSEGPEKQSLDQEKGDENLKAQHLKESENLPNGEVAQDEDEGVDLRGSYVVTPRYY